ncbi:recombinase family protein [Defluviitalea phaphyphila]|uniref:recombinase family protein n=1 Tax=Defluviitalea phaphyphila TaxID=1473580 RepID=UPI00073123FA|nr:recombinase family protein [Defluviitalea phaphyphila]
MIAIYARQSIDKKDSLSIESQIEFCKKEIFNEEYKIYTDRGFSGGNTNRPAFEQLLNDIRAGLITKVIVYKLDRISRSILDFASIINIFKKYNVDFQSSTEKFDTSTPIGNAMLNITMVFAQLERETIQKRIKDNYYARGKKGFYMGGRAPYGYKKIETKVEGVKTYKFITNNTQSQWVVKMYDLYANSDMSLGQISDYLNDKGIKAAQGGAWDSSKISRILRNPVYVKADGDIYLYYKNKGCKISNKLEEFQGINGCYLYGKRKSNERKYTNVKNHVLSIALHKGIIDSKTFLTCQYKLDKNKQIKNTGKGKHSYLSGIVKCGYCGYSMSVYTSGTYKYLKCRGKTNYKNCKGHKRPIYVYEVEDVVEKHLMEKVNEIKNSKIKVEKVENKEINKINLQIIKIDEQIENLINQIALSNAVVNKYINKKIEQLDNRKKELANKIKNLVLKNSQNKSIEDVLSYTSKWNESDLEEKKKIINCFVNRVYVKDDEVTIEWKI